MAAPCAEKIQIETFRVITPGRVSLRKVKPASVQHSKIVRMFNDLSEAALRLADEVIALLNGL